MATTYTMTAGDTKYIVVTVEDELGVAVDIGGASIKLVVAPDVDSTALVTKTTGGGGITITGTSEFTCKRDPADTASLTPAKYYMESQITETTGDVSTILKDKLKITKGLIV